MSWMLATAEEVLFGAEFGVVGFGPPIERGQQVEALLNHVHLYDRAAPCGGDDVVERACLYEDFVVAVEVEVARLDAGQGSPGCGAVGDGLGLDEFL